MKKILIAILVKNAEDNLTNLARNLLGLDYSKEDLTIIFLESDSGDDSYQLLKNKIVPMLQTRYPNVILEQKDYGFALPQSRRHLPEYQDERYLNLAKSRQYIVDNYLKENDYLWFVDADFELIPPDTLMRLMEHDVDMVIPVLKLSDGTLYDIGTKKNEKTLDRLANEMGEGLLEVDYTSGPSLIKRKVFDSGLSFFPIAKGDQEFVHLSREASRIGLIVRADCSTVVIHQTKNGMQR